MRGWSASHRMTRMTFSDLRLVGLGASAPLAGISTGWGAQGAASSQHLP